MSVDGVDGPRPMLCVHGHFYQPPREDPRTGRIPHEPGAEPYPNFNARITAECYRPNAQLGNFARLSFDLGPTLATWLAAQAADVHTAIVAQAGESGGAGGAMAQAYNHRILPLATRRDIMTQVRWGMADFTHRFGQAPRGMWLPETAVDRQTLDVLAENGIEFTILAPWQALEPVETRRPHRVQLSSGRSIAVFFYDGPLSADVSFNADATRDADEFASTRLAPRVLADGPTGVGPGITVIASDGELYGHHQPGREHFLHALLFGEADRVGYEVGVPATYLAQHGVGGDVAIAERTAWSCPHGLARWSTGCACTQGDSAWKRIVFEALAWLTERMDAAFESVGGRLLYDPWAARDAYIHVLLGERALRDLIDEHAARALGPEERSVAGQLLEGQVFGQRMHTSCGLFWEDLNRLEMRNNLAYAARAIRCTEAAAGVSLGAEFRRRLQGARSAATSVTGDRIYTEVAGSPR